MNLISEFQKAKNNTRLIINSYVGVKTEKNIFYNIIFSSGKFRRGCVGYNITLK